MSVDLKHTLVISGWQIGFNKVEFTKMLKVELDMGLNEAKATTDAVVDGTLLELPIGDRDFERIAKRAVELGAIVETQNEERPCR